MHRLSEDVRERVQAAVVSPRARDELLAAGLEPCDIRRLLRHGSLYRHHGHYIGGHLRPEIARMACALAAYPGSTISHFTAATLAELRTWVDRERDGRPPQDATWLTRPSGRGRAGATGDLVLRLASLDPCEVRELNRLIITADARTVVDLARELPFREAVVTVDHALAVSVTRAELASTLDRQAGWPGVDRARKAIAFGDPRSESVLESVARAAFARWGLPAPVLQATFWSGAGWMPERVDFWWPQFNTFAEADGLAKYEAATPQERRRQLRRAFLREQRLADLGLEMVRFGWEDAVQDDESLAGRLRAAQSRGLRRSGPTPRWRTEDPADLRIWPRLPPPDDAAP